MSSIWMSVAKETSPIPKKRVSIPVRYNVDCELEVENVDNIPRDREVTPDPADDFIMTNDRDDHMFDLWLKTKPKIYRIKPSKMTRKARKKKIKKSLINSPQKQINIPEPKAPPPPPPPSIPTPSQSKPVPVIPPKKTLYPDIECKKTENEEKEYEALNDKYINIMSEIDGYGKYSAIEGLVDRSTYSSHKDDKADPQSDNMKKIMKEIRKQLPSNIYTSINGSMFVRFDENNPRYLQVLLTGIDDTPYESGLFLFDIYLCDDYPNKPLNIKHISHGATKCHANNGPGGFSPNLHQSTGKVCLSLLGTWSGPGWEAGKSNVYQVVSTIMFMIFGADHPYYMEPSYGGWEGTVIGRKEHERRVIDYDEEVMYHNLKYSMLETIKNPYIGFEDVIKNHFKLKSEWILKTINRWLLCDNYTKGFKDKMKPILEEIKQEFEKLKK